jgi:A/G-specific adenine glycosylase
MSSNFTRKLMHWNDSSNSREMPWKGEKDPYKIWLSEVILQQTRVQQGWSYYNRFIEKYPSIRHLAAAPDDDVFKLWEGLGYYSRCRNLLHTARTVTEKYAGTFPADFESIRDLKGIGEYTASAIASFAFGLPYAVVDGNVQRVLSRFFGMRLPVDSKDGRNEIINLARQNLETTHPGKYNQAIIDLGATICVPRNPLCTICPLQTDCIALNSGTMHDLPVKLKAVSRRTRYFNYFVVTDNQRVLIRKRTEKDIWQNLYEFVMIESDSFSDDPLQLFQTRFSIKASDIREQPKQVRHQLTHQDLHSRFILLTTTEVNTTGDYFPVTLSSVANYPFPRLITRYLSQHPLENR